MYVLFESVKYVRCILFNRSGSLRKSLTYIVLQRVSVLFVCNVLVVVVIMIIWLLLLFVIVIIIIM